MPLEPITPQLPIEAPKPEIPIPDRQVAAIPDVSRGVVTDRSDGGIRWVLDALFPLTATINRAPD